MLYTDSEESAKREIAIFFPEFDCEYWYTEEESQLRDRTAMATHSHQKLRHYHTLSFHR